MGMSRERRQGPVPAKGARRAGSLVFVSGQLPIVDGKPVHTGRVGSTVGLDDACAAARIAALNTIAQAAAVAGSLDALQRNLARLVRAGALVAVGTEAPAIPYGLGIHLEMALLADADIPPDQVLRIATASNALALGLDRQLGTIEEGKLADLVVVDGNPLIDVGDALNVVAVVRGGVWIDSETLLR